MNDFVDLSTGDLGVPGAAHSSSDERGTCDWCCGTGWMGHPDDPSGRCTKCNGTGEIPIPSSADLREALICRPLTAVERAADDYADAVRERKAAWHAMGIAELSPIERKMLGIKERSR